MKLGSVLAVICFTVALGFFLLSFVPLNDQESLHRENTIQPSSFDLSNGSLINHYPRTASDQSKGIEVYRTELSIEARSVLIHFTITTDKAIKLPNGGYFPLGVELSDPNWSAGGGLTSFPIYQDYEIPAGCCSAFSVMKFLYSIPPDSRFSNLPPSLDFQAFLAIGNGSVLFSQWYKLI